MPYCGHTGSDMAPVFFSRSNAARHAIKRGLRAFETLQPVSSDPTCWTYEDRGDGPTIDYALAWSEGKDWVHHCEVTLKKIPVLIVTCLREEILEDVPALFEIRPLTPSMWEKEKAFYPHPVRVPKLPRGAPQRVASADAGSSIPKTPRVPAPRPDGKRATGAKAVVQELYDAMPGATKAEVVAACVARGIFKGTAAARYSDIVKK